MSSTVNPILVVRNNLPAFADELMAERTKLQDRIAVLDAELRMLVRLEAALYDGGMSVTDGEDA